MPLSDPVILYVMQASFLLHYISSICKDGSCLAYSTYWEIAIGDSYVPPSCWGDDTYITGYCYYAWHAHEWANNYCYRYPE
jgi:hypothetical protein